MKTYGAVKDFIEEKIEKLSLITAHIMLMVVVVTESVKGGPHILECEELLL